MDDISYVSRRQEEIVHCSAFSLKVKVADRSRVTAPGLVDIWCTNLYGIGFQIECEFLFLCSGK